MSVIHFLNVLEGDCNIIQHGLDNRVTVIDISNAYNNEDTPAEKTVKKIKEELFKKRTLVPSDKKDYKQKEYPENPIAYLNQFGIKNIFRFIITHPDMDHLDGIKDLFSSINVQHTWDTANNKQSDVNANFGGYNPEDWTFYTNIRDGKYTNTTRLVNYSGYENQFWTNDNLKILCPTKELVENSNKDPKGDYHDCSYVLLYTPPKKDGKQWKIVFAGDSHDNTWSFILENYKEEIKNVDVLFAPHHGRDSNRNYDFINVLKPKLTLFGNASAEHLAYTKYPKIRITNNQAGSVILDVTENAIVVYVKNKQFAIDFTHKRGWDYIENKTYNAYGIIQFTG
jgi:beta-lactamase superfamily II metal-dependent hydrolase